MATCSAGPSRCRIVCNGACGCIYVHSADACTCECFDDAGPSGATFGLATVVSISVAGLSLGQVAARADRLLAREVMVPAARARQPVTLKMKRVRFSAVLKKLGLTTRRPARPKAGTRSARRGRRGSLARRPGS
jgi:hypothetical protein